jgi:hypothetical protein
MNVRCRQLTFRSFSICSFPVQISKANDRIATGDVVGANAGSYTLTEQLPKFFLQEAEVAYKYNEGSIQARSRAAQP